MEYIHSTPSSILSILLIFTHLNFVAVCGLGRMLPLLKREEDSYAESYNNLIKVIHRQGFKTGSCNSQRYSLDDFKTA